MNIASMHNVFRQYAQQMGMQNIRAIRPEQIDIVINTSIMDEVNRLLKQNVNLTNDRTSLDSSKIGQINAFKTLYKSVEVPITQDFVTEDGSTLYLDIRDFNEDNTFDCLFLVKFAINYNHGEKVTRYFPLRLIEEEKLEETLSDFHLKPTIMSPVCVVVNNQLTVYMCMSKNVTPCNIKVSYIDFPTKVHFDAQDSDNNRDCDLPEYLHEEIVRHAVDLYRVSISGSLYDNQSTQTQQSPSVNNNT